MIQERPRVPGTYDLEHFAGQVDPELWGSDQADIEAERLFTTAVGTPVAPRGYREVMFVGVYQDGTTVRLTDLQLSTIRWKKSHNGEPCNPVTVTRCRFHAKHNLCCDECGGFLTVADSEMLENERQATA